MNIDMTAMEGYREFWKSAVEIGGISTVAFFSMCLLYGTWLRNLGDKLTRKQIFVLLILGMSFVGCSVLLTIGLHEGRQIIEALRRQDAQAEHSHTSGEGQPPSLLASKLAADPASAKGAVP